jgi:hypothetical protein
MKESGICEGIIAIKNKLLKKILDEIPDNED